MHDKKYLRRVAIHGITIDGKTYWNPAFIKHIGEKVAVQFIDKDTIKVFLESNFLCQAKNREIVHIESLIKKPWRKNEEKSLKKVPTCDLVNELINRSGVTKYVAEPYADFSFKIAGKEYKSSGPANILIVID